MKDDPQMHELLAESPQDELWLISYADLLTLLIGFFVLLLAVSPVKVARYEQLAANLSKDATQAPLVELREQVDALVAEAGLEDRVTTWEDAEGLGIELKDVLLFDSGSADVSDGGLRLVGQVATLLRGIEGRPIIVEGHTDDLPIKTARFSSNWELSSQRAINVLAALEDSGVARARMSVRAYADTRASATLASADGANVARDTDNDARRAARRRVIIRVE